MINGYEKLKAAREKDCSQYSKCFNPDGCKLEKTKCFHRYCDTFAWVINRAKHYAGKTGLKWEEILNAWEDKRNYWYMNYYQDGNQPLLDGTNVKVYENIEEAKAKIGKEFRCPACGGISTDPYECNSGQLIQVIKNNTKKKKMITCNWKVYGLFQDLGKGIYIFVKDKAIGQRIFMPIAYEKQSEVNPNDK